MGLAARQRVVASRVHPRLAHGQVRRIATATILWLVFVANAAVIVVLWLRGGGVSGVHHLGDLLTSLGRITGLLGAYLLLIQVLLLARLTVFERLTGFDRLTVWHRRNGKLALYLVLAHVVLITIGYALTDRLSIPAKASQLLGSYPGMVTATVGTGLLVLIYRVLNQRDLVFRAELEELARDRGIALHYVIGDHRTPGCEHLMSPGHLRQLVPDIEQREVYLCGPSAMADFIAHSVRQAGVPRTSIHSERFTL